MNLSPGFKLFFTTIMLTIAVGIRSAHAQKAYDNVTYKTSINGNPAVLTLADGYLLASKITIYSKQGNQVFSPEANEANEQGELQFNFVKGTGVYKNNKGAWIMLKGLNEPELPSQIKAINWDGKMRKEIIFKQ